MDAAMITAGATIGNAILQNSLNKKNLREQRAYEEKVRREQNAYNSAQAVKNRLMMAGASDTQALYSTMGYQPAPVSDFQQGLQYEATGIDASAIGSAVASDQSTELGYANLEMQKSWNNSENSRRNQQNEETCKNIRAHTEEILQNVSQQKGRWVLEQAFRNLQNAQMDTQNKIQTITYFHALVTAWNTIPNFDVTPHNSSEAGGNGNWMHTYVDGDLSFSVDDDDISVFNDTAYNSLNELYHQVLGNREKAQWYAQNSVNEAKAMLNLLQAQGKLAFANGDAIEMRNALDSMTKEAREEFHEKCPTLYDFFYGGGMDAVERTTDVIYGAVSSVVGARTGGATARAQEANTQIQRDRLNADIDQRSKTKYHYNDHGDYYEYYR